ncbi:MAG: YvcK family protein [Nitrospirae bacterium]|nr:YvcK family protein [Nitrospirota bacterium]
MKRDHHSGGRREGVGEVLARLNDLRFGPLDLMPRATLAEKLIELALAGPPPGANEAIERLRELQGGLAGVDTRDAKVVVLGGGSGLSNIVGGDSRSDMWPASPFMGLKEIFPHTTSIVSIADDGGSTGELIRQFPLIALGDIRHVLLSSVQMRELRNRYGIRDGAARRIAGVLHRLINHRFEARPASPESLLDAAGVNLAGTPLAMAHGILELLELLFTHKELSKSLDTPHCLGNLLVASAIFRAAASQSAREIMGEHIVAGVRALASLIGARAGAVLPCSVTPAQLKVLYNNGVLVTGEYKSSVARRGYPVDRVFLEFASEPEIPAEVMRRIDEADIIVLAPGSTYTSIVPVLQAPGIADAIRRNKGALKILVANLWVQRGETDLVYDDPARRYHVSDLISAYNRNIPGGVGGLFRQVMVLGLQRIPGDVIQNYAVEKKTPIYLDRANVSAMGFEPVEAMIFSQEALHARNVIQHDPASMALTVKTLWAIKDYCNRDDCAEWRDLPLTYSDKKPIVRRDGATPYARMREAGARLGGLDMNEAMRDAFTRLLWNHRDIPLDHLDLINGAVFIDKADWRRSQDWDNVLSFYDPQDGIVKLRSDIEANPLRFEVGLLVAIGESLLGNYAAKKWVAPLNGGGDCFGKVYNLQLCPPDERRCYLSEVELHDYLTLVRMCRSDSDDFLYRRVIGGSRAFTPPGLMFGLTYAWYIDNRFASHIEYKMSIMKMEITDLIPEQLSLLFFRRALVEFFRRCVFRCELSTYTGIRREHGRGGAVING